MNILKDTMSEMTYKQIEKWCRGDVADINLIPNGYVGAPESSRYIKTSLKDADRQIAKDIFRLV